jgi:NADH-quinone oxidoreductase subunit L
MWIGSLALAGVGIPGLFGFAGFYSKDMILESAFGANSLVGDYAFWMGIAAALMTAFYSWRLIFLTFHGKPRCDTETLAHVHESPMVMWLPLVVLALGSVVAGAIGYRVFVGDGMEEFWGRSILVLQNHDSISAAHFVPLWVKLLPLVVGAVGIGLAVLMYLVWTGLPGKLARLFRPLYLLSYNKWYFDELYDLLFVRPAFYIGRGLWKSGDGSVIDGVGPDGIAEAVQGVARRASALQSGYLYHYAFAMLIGVAALVTGYLYVAAG